MALLYHPNDIIVSCAGTYWRKVLVCPKNGFCTTGIINQALKLIRLYNPEIEGFLCHVLRLFILKQEAYEECGTAVKTNIKHK